MTLSIREGINGFENGQDDSTLSYDRVTRTVTLTPTPTGTNTHIKVFVAGRPFFYDTPQTATHPNVSGLYAFIIDDTGVMQAQASSTITEQIILRNALVAIVYWNAEQGREVIFGDERHGLMDSESHAHFHAAIGAQIQRDSSEGAFRLLGIDMWGGGNFTGSAQVAMEAGTLLDEDVELRTDTTGQVLGTPAASNPLDNAPIAGAVIPTIWRGGPNGIWYIQDGTSSTGTGAKTADVVPLDVTVALPTYTGALGDRHPWNEFTGATWQLTEPGTNGKILIHLFAWNDVNTRIVAVVGQNLYASTSDARDAAPAEMLNLVFDGIPLPEFRPLYTLILDTNVGFSNESSGRWEPVDNFNNPAIDWRFAFGGQGGGVTGGPAGATTFAALTDTNVVGVATGDVLYWDGADWTNLAIGAQDEVLTVSASGLPEWAAAGSGGGSLQDAYDLDEAVVLAAATPISITAATPGTEDALWLRGRVNMEGATDSVVIGNALTDVDGDDCVYVGNNIDGNAGNFHYAFGTDITFTGVTSAVAVGNTITVAQDGVVVGVSTSASGEDSVAIGRSTTAAGNNAVAIGFNSDAVGNDSFAVGRLSDATGPGAVALGLGTTAGDSSVAIGETASAAGTDAIAIGLNAGANNNVDIAIGRQAFINAGSNVSIALGFAARVESVAGGVSSIDSIAIGRQALVQGSDAVCIGNTAKVLPSDGEDGTGISDNSTAVGRAARTQGANNSAFGVSATATGGSATAIGASTDATGASSVAMGDGALAAGASSVAIGPSASASDTSAVAIGPGATIASGGAASVALGNGALAPGFRSVAIGRQANASATVAVSIGNESDATGANCVALGHSAQATGTDATAIGTSASATGARSTAVGEGASDGGFANATVLGQDAAVTGAGGIAIGRQASAGADEVVIRVGGTNYRLNFEVGGNVTWTAV